MPFDEFLPSDQELTVDRSTSLNYHGNYIPKNAYDGNYNTWYSVKDNEVAGNYLKLYLFQADKITEVKMTSRPGRGFVLRMVNTEVRVYSTENGEREVASCGRITGELR